MSANQQPRLGGQNSDQDDPPLPSNRNLDSYPFDAEQLRRDMFHDAVQQALARHAKDSQRKGGRDAQVHSAEILTSCELKFLLKQDV